MRKELLDPTPHSVERCKVPLQVAIACMTELTRQLSGRGGNAGDDGPLRTELFGLRRDLTNVNALLQNASSFYAGYARLLQADAPECIGDYSPAARVASLRSERNFVVHG